mgnify:CR=1 FL=1
MTDLRAAILARCGDIEREDPRDSTYTTNLPDWEDLVAGAREMCEVHQPAVDPDYHQPGCRGCGMDRTGEWMERLADCPTLSALARMLGAGNV